MTCIFRDKDTARFLMGTAVQTGGKQLGVHNISTVSNGDQIIKKKKKKILQNYNPYQLDWKICR